MRGPVELREASAADTEALLAIQHACAEAPQWSEAVWRGVLSAPGSRVTLAAVADASVCAFLVAHCAAGVAEIESLAVGTSMRRQGVARALCDRAIAWARAQAAGEMQLEVRASSSAGISLYRVLGFREQGRRARYYRDPADDAILMSLAL